MSSVSLRTQVAIRAGIAASALSKKLGRGEGSVIGGRVSLVIDPHSLENLSLDRCVVLVSGTNGKTTTTAMLVEAVQTSSSVVTNAAGANMFGGMVGALSASDAPIAILEVDESHFAQTLLATKAKFVVLLNLSRDQLDRVGEVRMQAQKWRTVLEELPTTAIANADDPLVVWAASTARATIWVAAGSAWKMDAASCPACGARIHWTEDNWTEGNGQDQDWACTGCELRRPQPHTFFSAPRPQGENGRNEGRGNEVAHRSGDISLTVDLKLPGDVNRRNASVALTAAMLVGADPYLALKAISEMRGTEGRFASVNIEDCAVRLILAKNPAGWTEALRIAYPAPRPLVVAINSRVQDGRDPSWLWDVPFEQLVGQFVVATGERGRDLAVRLRYANVDHIFIDSLTQAIKHASAKTESKSEISEKSESEIDVIGNYSAFQEFRKLAAE